MRFYIDTTELNAGISTVIKAMSSRSNSMTILEGIYIAAYEGSILLKCSDLSLQIETILPATVEEEGAIVLPGRIFSEMAKKLPGDSVYISNEENTVTIKSGRAQTTLQASSAMDYPDMPEVGAQFSVKIKQRTLKDMIKQSIFATAQDDTKPILTGVLMELNANELTMVALDGYRLAMRRERLDGEYGERSVVVPGKSLSEIRRILNDGDEDMVTLTFSKTHVSLDMGYTTVISRLLDGEFIRYKQILPEDHATRASINRQELLDAIERASLMAREGKNNLIKFSFKDEIVVLTANNDLGRIQEEIPITNTGNELDIAFNSKYFSDVLKCLEDDELFLDMNNNISPCVVRPMQGDEFFYLILPVRLFSGM